MEAAHGESAGIPAPPLANSSKNDSAAAKLASNSDLPALYASKNPLADLAHTGSGCLIIGRKLLDKHIKVV